MHISIATEQITVQKIHKKLLSKCPPEFGFFSRDAVPGVRGTPLPLLPRQCLPRELDRICGLPPDCNSLSMMAEKLNR